MVFHLCDALRFNHLHGAIEMYRGQRDPPRGRGIVHGDTPPQLEQGACWSKGVSANGVGTLLLFCGDRTLGAKFGGAGRSWHQPCEPNISHLRAIDARARGHLASPSHVERIQKLAEVSGLTRTWVPRCRNRTANCDRSGRRQASAA